MYGSNSSSTATLRLLSFSAPGKASVVAEFPGARNCSTARTYSWHRSSKSSLLWPRRPIASVRWGPL